MSGIADAVLLSSSIPQLLLYSINALLHNRVGVVYTSFLPILVFDLEPTPTSSELSETPHTPRSQLGQERLPLEGVYERPHIVIRVFLRSE